jgi:hypothetical protein
MAVADTSVADARPAKPGGPAVYIGNGQAGERHLANGIGLDEFRSASLVAEVARAQPGSFSSSHPSSSSVMVCQRPCSASG